TMIFYGVLRGLTTRWAGDSEGSLQNALLCGQGSMISAEPVKRLCELARAARSNPEFVDLLCRGSIDEIAEVLGHYPDFKEDYDAYLQQFGERCLDELKLESSTL